MKTARKNGREVAASVLANRAKSIEVYCTRIDELEAAHVRLVEGVRGLIEEWEGELVGHQLTTLLASIEGEAGSATAPCYVSQQEERHGKRY